MPALLTDTVEYANQVLRSKKVEDLNSRRTNPAGRPVEDQVALARQKAVENQVQSDPSRFLPSQKALLRQPGVEEVIPNSTTATQLGDESVMILSARGTFYLVKLATAYGPGIYAIDELTRSVIAPDFTGPVQDRPGETNSPILLTSIEFNQVDITSQVPCLNNVKVFYSFGQNFGQVVISGEVLLGPLGNISYDGVNRLVDFFWKYRVSVYKKPIAISVANNSYFVYLTGLRISQVNADFHILPFVMFGTLLDIEREKANAVNTTGVVITEGSLEEPSLFDALTSELPDSLRDTQAAKSTSTEFPKVGETPTKVSQTVDPSLYATPGGGSSHAGAGGVRKTSEIDAELQTIMRKTELAMTLTAPADNQHTNLQAGSKKQELFWDAEGKLHTGDAQPKQFPVTYPKLKEMAEPIPQKSLNKMTPAEKEAYIKRLNAGPPPLIPADYNYLPVPSNPLYVPNG